MKTKIKQVVENQVVNNNKKSQSTENQAVNKLTKIEKLDKAINKGLTTENQYYKLLAISANAKKEMFSLSKVYQTFIDYSVIQGSEMLTDKQKELLTFARIKGVVNNTDKLKVKQLFSLHDVVLICNRILTENSKAIKVAIKVAKQGGTITTKK